MNAVRNAMIVGLLGISAVPTAQSTDSPQSPDSEATQCSNLARLDLSRLDEAPTTVLSARLVDVPAAGLEGPREGPWEVPPIATAVTRYCQVTGYVAPQNKFELRLPVPAQWNQRFFFTTCGGFCGALESTACNPGLARGYASVTTNGGHESAWGFDGTWGAYAPRLQEDFAWRGTHLVTKAAKVITGKYYGRSIVRSYISGCSKGGHAVLLQAQRFPEDYDGYLPIAPVYDITGRMIAAAWFAQAVSDGEGGSVLDDASAGAIHASVLSRCGAQSGVDEGLVIDPVACDWRPEMLACMGRSGTDTRACLAPRQVAAVKRLMSPVVNGKGEILYRYPYVPGTETEWGIWNYGPTVNNPLAQQFLQFLADPMPRAESDPLKFDFDHDPATLARARAVYDATSHDLRALKARGGKILMWHGLADAGIVATSSIGYLDGVTRMMGGRRNTEDFFRLFLVPGVHHCGGGPGLTDFDALTLLENWVEKGIAPDSMVVSRASESGDIERSRPIYPYPLQARYRSPGDPKTAASFVPAAAADAP